MAQFQSLNPINKLLRWMSRAIRSLLTKAAIGLPYPQERLSDILTGTFIALFLVGILIFLTKADFSKDGWVETYFIWDKSKDLLGLFLLLLLKPKFRLYLLLILGLATIRFIWDILAYSLKIDINLQLPIIMLWGTATCIIVFLSVKDLLSLWKRN